MLFLLPHTIEEVAEKNPDKEAIRIYNKGLSYGELVQRSNQLARRLRAEGVRRSDRVGIYMNKCMETAVAIYGVMKAGAAYVPLDPSSPTMRIKTILSDCGIRHVISNSGKVRKLEEILSGGGNVECILGLKPLDTLPVRCVPWDTIFQETEKNSLGTRITEQDLAYIMYTSGSTGTPKGIMHTHHSGLSYARWAASAYSLHSEDRLTNHAPLHFDLSTFDYFAGALAGATTIIVPEEYMKLSASYSKLLQDEKISVFFTVPYSLIQLLLRGALSERDLRALRWIIFGGEPFPTKYLRDLMKALPHCGFSNMYGPAEVNGCTYYNLPSIPEPSEDSIPIGKVCPNIEGIVLNEDDELAHQGEIGELLIRSPTMMQGYWGRADLNKKAFYYRKVFEDYNEVFYRTGDLVQLRKDGNYKFCGRKDRQVKIRGYRVELDEIEAAIVAHNQVEEAAVFSVRNDDGTSQIEAAVIGKQNGNPEVRSEELTAHLRDSVPWYALPSEIVIQNDFPRTTSGKIDRRKLEEQAKIKRA